MDKFEQFETSVTGWISRHKFITMKVAGILIVITIAVLITTLMASYVGMNLVWMMVSNAHNGEQNTTMTSTLVVDEQTMNNWDTIIIPIFTGMMYWQQGLILVLVFGYIGMVIYLVARYIYRKKRRGVEQECMQ